MAKRCEQFRRAGAQLVTISTDAAQELKAYREKNSASFTMLSDAERAVISEYGVLNPSERGGVAVPAVFIVDTSGIVRYSKIQQTLLRVRNKKLLKEVQKI